MKSHTALTDLSDSVRIATRTIDGDGLIALAFQPPPFELPFPTPIIATEHKYGITYSNNSKLITVLTR
jgi:hypothetical protein